MKTKVVVLLFMIFLSYFAQASKTFTRDQTLCDLNGQKIELSIEGSTLYGGGDGDYGESLALQDRAQVIKLQGTGIGRYRFLPAQNTICSKVMGVMKSKHEAIFFILRDNRPLPDYLMILSYNTESQAASLSPTNLMVSESFSIAGKSFFKVAATDLVPVSGTTQINGERFHFVEKILEPWVSYDGERFKLDRDLTFQKFEHKRILDRGVVDRLDGFQELKYILAKNPTSGRTCLSVMGSTWNCL